MNSMTESHTFTFKGLSIIGIRVAGLFFNYVLKYSQFMLESMFKDKIEKTKLKPYRKKQRKTKQRIILWNNFFWERNSDFPSSHNKCYKYNNFPSFFSTSLQARAMLQVG